MWIDATFGDLKSNGFDLESTILRHFLCLSRLNLAVVLLHVRLIAFGSQVIRSGQRCLVDRSDRRDDSIFRIGRNMVEWLLTNGAKLHISFFARNSKLSAGLKILSKRYHGYVKFFKEQWDSFALILLT